MKRKFGIYAFLVFTFIFITGFPYLQNPHSFAESNNFKEYDVRTSQITFINPIENGEIFSKNEYVINISADAHNSQIRLFSTDENNPELDWTDMDNVLDDLWNYTIMPLSFPIGIYNLSINTTYYSIPQFKSTLIEINWTKYDTITFIDPLPSALINQTDFYNINVSASVLENIGDAELRIFSDNSSEPELNWTAMTHLGGNLWNYSLNFTEWSAFDYNFSVRVPYFDDGNGKLYFENSTIVTVNVTLPIVDNGGSNNNDDNGNPNLLVPRQNSFDPISLLILLVIIIFSLSIFFVLKRKNKKYVPNTNLKKKQVWFEEIREKNADVLSGLTIKAKPKTNGNGNGNGNNINGNTGRGVGVVRAVEAPRKLQSSSTYDDPPEPTEEELRELEKTQAEMSVFKAQHTCIVHKGKIDGKIYICPECQTVYCIACAEVIKLKNETCWSCGKPITI